MTKHTLQVTKQELRDLTINAAIAEGKFPESRRAHYERLFDADMVATSALIRDLAPALPAANVSASSYPESWLPDVRKKSQRIAAAGGRRPRVSFD
jgi:hypothetical protein